LLVLNASWEDAAMGRNAFLTSVFLAVGSLSTPDHAIAQSDYQLTVPAPAGFDRGRVQRDTEAYLVNLIGLDTQNPPGNELRVASYLESVLSGLPGIETHVMELSPGRANFIARLHAMRPSKKPILLMGHSDVVGVDLTKWDTPPFETKARDGYLYGRGTIDDKGMLAAGMTALLCLARERDSLDRDIILLATAGEESGGAGIQWIVEHDFGRIEDVEFALDEGGRVRAENGTIRLINIQTTEKIAYNVVGTASGPSGHASIPLPNNALAAMARAVAKIHEWKAPVRLSETTRSYFSGLALVERDPAMKQAMEVLASSHDPVVVNREAEFVSQEPRYNAVLRTGVSVTLLNGGIRSNVIPSQGTANFNVRVLPGEEVRKIIGELNRVAGESQVIFSLVGEPRPWPPVSPTTTAIYRALENAARAMAPEVVVSPFMSTGGTDGAVLREKGIPTYGILPLPLAVEDEVRMHGDNERVPIAALGWAAEYLYRVLFIVAGR
jgi:acetylornithine deacetylase/succinyl-diaminopimelate desuccinylase-like protein